MYKTTRHPLKLFRQLRLINEVSVSILTQQGLVKRETPQFNQHFVTLLHRVSNLTLLLLAMQFINRSEAQASIDALFTTMGASVNEQQFLRSLTDPFLQFFADSLASSSLTFHSVITSTSGYALISSSFIFRASAALMKNFNEAANALASRADNIETLCKCPCASTPTKVSRPVVNSIAFILTIWLINQFVNEPSLQASMQAITPGINSTCQASGLSPWTTNNMKLFCAGSEKITATTGFVSILLKGFIAYVTLQLLDSLLAMATERYKQYQHPRSPIEERSRSERMTIIYDPEKTSTDAITTALHQVVRPAPTRTSRQSQSTPSQNSPCRVLKRTPKKKNKRRRSSRATETQNLQRDLLRQLRKTQAQKQTPPESTAPQTPGAQM